MIENKKSLGGHAPRVEKKKISKNCIRYLKRHIEESEKVYGKSSRIRYYEGYKNINGRPTIYAGVTNFSIGFFREKKNKIGSIQKVECVYLRESPYLTYNTRIIGTEGEILLSGFNCGYSGEGPGGLWVVLKEIGIENRKFHDTELAKEKNDHIVYSLTESGWKIECRNPEEVRVRLRGGK